LVILGGGAAAVATARRLLRSGDGSLDLTLIARHPWMTPGQRLAAVAAGRLDPGQAAAPLRPLLPGCKLRIAEVVGVDPMSRQVQLRGAEVEAGLCPPSLPYDDLVLALGAAPAPRPPALPFHDLASALAIRQRLASTLALATREESPRKRKTLLTAVILGGDPLACALAAELLASLRRAADRWPLLDPTDPRVVLIAPAGLLPDAPPRIAQAARRALRDHGVELHLSVEPRTLQEDHVVLDAERIDTRLVLTTLDPAAPPCLTPFRGALPRVAVSPSLASPSFPGVWALGACADAPGTLPWDRDAQADLVARGLLPQKPSLSPLRLLPLAPGLGAGSLGPLPLPSSMVWNLSTIDALARWWPGSSWLDRLLGRAGPGLLPGAPGPVPSAPLPSLPLPPIPLDGPTAVGFPFTLPLPPAGAEATKKMSAAKK
jgi:NADH dehydrogenase FAD-containing subunit